MHSIQIHLTSVLAIIVLLSGCEKESRKTQKYSSTSTLSINSSEKDEEHTPERSLQKNEEKNKKVIQALKKVVDQLEAMEKERCLFELDHFRIECSKAENGYHFSIIPLPAAPGFQNTIIIKNNGEVVVVPW